MSQGISVTYEINPPAGSSYGDLTRSNTLTFSLKSALDKGYDEYYAALRDAIESARGDVGNELTAWRDAVGKAELKKETKKTLKYDEVDEDEDE
ncbi:hypothetical protein BD779DRAFT_1638387 [Infundibulicybe gibba]|nr:hypothetical protein BD779DRAFT_1638387 [Infundibulicybe gibba]